MMSFREQFEQARREGYASAMADVVKGIKAVLVDAYGDVSDEMHDQHLVGLSGGGSIDSPVVWEMLGRLQQLVAEWQGGYASAMAEVVKRTNDLVGETERDHGSDGSIDSPVVWEMLGQLEQTVAQCHEEARSRLASVEGR